MKGKRRRDLTREEWCQLATKFRQTIDLMGDCDELLSQSVTVAEMARYRKAFGRIQRLKSRLDGLACSQHQDWPEASKLFYGAGQTFYVGWI